MVKQVGAIVFDGWKEFEVDVTNASNKMKAGINGLTAKMAQSFQAAIIKQYKWHHNRAQYLASGHNTPGALYKRVKYVNEGIGKKRIMPMAGGRGNQPRYLEFGTPPHKQDGSKTGRPNYWNSMRHPGARPFHTWQLTEEKWIQQRYPYFQKKAFDMIRGVIRRGPGGPKKREFEGYDTQD